MWHNNNLQIRMNYVSNWRKLTLLIPTSILTSALLVFPICTLAQNEADGRTILLNAGATLIEQTTSDKLPWGRRVPEIIEVRFAALPAKFEFIHDLEILVNSIPIDDLPCDQRMRYEFNDTHLAACEASLQRAMVLQLTSTDVSDKCLDTLVRLPKLIDIDLSCTAVTKRGIARLKEGKFQRLNLSRLDIDDEIASDIESLQRLQSLNLARTKCGDSTARAIARLEVIQNVDLSHSRIDDESLNILAKSTQLKRLVVAGCKLTDKSVDTVLSMSHLQEIDLRLTEITSVKISEMRKVRPNLLVRY